MLQTKKRKAFKILFFLSIPLISTPIIATSCSNNENPKEQQQTEIPNVNNVNINNWPSINLENFPFKIGDQVEVRTLNGNTYVGTIDNIWLLGINLVNVGYYNSQSITIEYEKMFVAWSSFAYIASNKIPYA